MPATVTKSNRGKGLTRATLIEAALELIDRDGLAALNFRRLAGELGVTTMAPYSHFANKEDLLDALTARAIGGLECRLDPTARWDAQVEQAMVDLHTALDCHPGVVDLILTRAEGERLNELRDALMAITMAQGLNETESADALRALVSYVLGFVVLTRAGAPVKVRRGSATAFEYGLAMLMESFTGKVKEARCR